MALLRLRCQNFSTNNGRRAIDRSSSPKGAVIHRGGSKPLSPAAADGLAATRRQITVEPRSRTCHPFVHDRAFIPEIVRRPLDDLARTAIAGVIGMQRGGRRI